MNADNAHWQNVRTIHREHRTFYELFGGFSLFAALGIIGLLVFAADRFGYQMNVYTELISLALTILVLDTRHRHDPLHRPQPPGLLATCLGKKPRRLTPASPVRAWHAMPWSMHGIAPTRTPPPPDDDPSGHQTASPPDPVCLSDIILKDNQGHRRANLARACVTSEARIRRGQSVMALIYRSPE